jgi:hypothetical protein
LRRFQDLLVVAVAVPPLLCAQPQPDAASGSLLRLDHVIVAVRNLESASDRFHALGFRIKPGKLHAGGLVNRHIKFRDQREVELMSLAGTPSGIMARAYARILESGDRGAYVALRTDSLVAVRRHAVQCGLPVRTSGLGSWKFLEISGVKASSPVFIVSGGGHVTDPDSVLDHQNGAIALESTSIEAEPLLDRFLLACGCRIVDAIRLPDGREGTRWALNSGSLVIVRAHGEQPPRVLGVELRRTARDSEPLIEQPIPDFWMVLH